MTHHPVSLNGRWLQFSFAEQMGNAGSEVYRTLTWHERQDHVRREAALERALELLDATASDPRWTMARKKEILRVREGFLSFLLGDNVQGWQAESLNQYFDAFAIVARGQVG